MFYKFVANGEPLSVEEHSSNAQATKRAEVLSAAHGKVEVWTPAFVVVPETNYKVIDYSKSKEY